ncbi:MAG: hypothetical protein P4L40_25195 [Terracidiphilus sp.]|nr:hypothetical protein [Terracidiphilus sp.]
MCFQGAQIVVLRDRLVTQARALQSNSTAFDFAALLSSALGTTTSVPSLLSSSSLNTLLDGVTSVSWLMLLMCDRYVCE